MKLLILAASYSKVVYLGMFAYVLWEMTMSLDWLSYYMKVDIIKYCHVLHNRGKYPEIPV